MSIAAHHVSSNTVSCHFGIGLIGQLRASQIIWGPLVHVVMTYTGRKGTTIVHETVVDLECFYHSFGYSGSCNDINVLDRSDTLFQIMTGEYGGPGEYTK